MTNWIPYNTDTESYQAPGNSPNRKQIFDMRVLHQKECKRVIGFTVKNTSQFDTVNNVAPVIVINNNITLLIGESYSVASPGVPFYDAQQYFIKVDNNGATTTPQYDISIQFIDESEK